MSLRCLHYPLQLVQFKKYLKYSFFPPFVIFATCSECFYSSITSLWKQVKPINLLGFFMLWLLFLFLTFWVVLYFYMFTLCIMVWCIPWHRLRVLRVLFSLVACVPSLALDFLSLFFEPPLSDCPAAVLCCCVVCVLTILSARYYWTLFPVLMAYVFEYL